MSIQKKVKFLISLAILVLIALCSVVVVQTFNISKAKKQLANQKHQIEQLEKQIDSYEKQPGSDYEEIN